MIHIKSRLITDFLRFFKNIYDRCLGQNVTTFPGNDKTDFSEICSHIAFLAYAYKLGILEPSIT